MSVEITRREIAIKTGLTRQHIDFIMTRKRRPSPELAALLERITGIDRRAWLYPDEFPNPLFDNRSEATHA